MTENIGGNPGRSAHSPNRRADSESPNPFAQENAEEFVNDAMYRAYNYTPLDEGEGDKGQNE